MIRALQLVSAALALVSAITVFQVKRDAEHAAERVAELQRGIAGEKEALSLLKAEWSLLIQPARVQELVERHGERLALQPFAPAQIATLGELPQRPAGTDEIDSAALAALIGDAEETTR